MAQYRQREALLPGAGPGLQITLGAMKHFDPRTTPRGAGTAGFTAANDAQGPSAPASEPRREHKLVTSGWDPFEIWRTRVRDARREAPTSARD